MTREERPRPGKSAAVPTLYSDDLIRLTTPRTGPCDRRPAEPSAVQAWRTACDRTVTNVGYGLGRIDPLSDPVLGALAVQRVRGGRVRDRISRTVWRVRTHPWWWHRLTRRSVSHPTAGLLRTGGDRR